MSAATVKVAATPVGDGRVDVWSRRAVREAGREFREALADALRGERLPASVAAVVTIAFGDRRAREPHNFERVLRRAIDDVLADQEQPPTLAAFDVRLRKGARRPSTTITLGESSGGQS